MDRGIAITGVSGYVGQRLLHALSAEPHGDTVIGIDLRPLPASSTLTRRHGEPRISIQAPAPTLPRAAGEGREGAIDKDVSVVQPIALPGAFRLLQMDVRDPALADSLQAEGVGALVHLAFIVQPLHDRRRMQAVNIEGTRAVLEAAARAGLAQVIFVSSVAVYGAHPDNPIPLTEKSPLRPNPDYSYALDKAEADRITQEFAARHPGLAVTILRPAIVLGPHVDNFFSCYLIHWPFLLAVHGGDGPMQFVHEDDLATCIVACLRRRARGVYNLAGEGSLGWREVLRRARRRYITLPAWWAYAVAALLWQARLPVAPPGQLAWVRFPSVVSTDKLAREVGFRPRRTTAAALSALLRTRCRSPERTPESLPRR